MTYPTIKKEPWKSLNTKFSLQGLRFRIWNHYDLPMWTNWVLRPYFYSQWRKIAKDMQPGMYVLGCPLHPAVITNCGYDNIEYWDLCLQQPGDCSIWHCGPEPIAEDEAIKYVDAYKKNGDKGINDLYLDIMEEKEPGYKERLSQYHKKLEIWTPGTKMPTF